MNNENIFIILILIYCLSMTKSKSRSRVYKNKPPTIFQKPPPPKIRRSNET